MDVDLPAEDDPRRVEVRAWFEAHPSPTPADLVDAGFVVPHWPRPYGLDAEPELQLIIEDEMRRAGASKPVNPIGIGHCGPILVALASDEQKQRYLMPMLRGEELWCQLFSEPDAGSDLANLAHACRARRRHLPRQRSEDLDVARRARQVRDPHRAHARRRVEAPRHLVLHHPDGPARYRSAADPRDDRRGAVQRGVLHRRARARREPDRRGAPRVGDGEDDARERARVTVDRRRTAVGLRPERA